MAQIVSSGIGLFSLSSIFQGIGRFLFYVQYCRVSCGKNLFRVTRSTLSMVIANSFRDGCSASLSNINAIPLGVPEYGTATTLKKRVGTTISCRPIVFLGVETIGPQVMSSALSRCTHSRICSSSSFQRPRFNSGICGQIFESRNDSSLLFCPISYRPAGSHMLPGRIRYACNHGCLSLCPLHRSRG